MRGSGVDTHKIGDQDEDRKGAAGFGSLEVRVTLTRGVPDGSGKRLETGVVGAE